MDTFLRTNEVAERLRISASALRKLVQQNRIPYIRLGERTIRFDPKAIDDWRMQFFSAGSQAKGTEGKKEAEEADPLLQAKSQSVGGINPNHGSGKAAGGRKGAPKAGSVAARAAERGLAILESQRKESEKANRQKA